MAPPSSQPAIPKLELQKGKKRKRRSKSPGLICCCRFVRHQDKLSPIYTARELSVTSLAIQQQLAATFVSPSQQRPLVTKANGKGQFRISMPPPFADDTPSNTADYLDCCRAKEAKEEENEYFGLETARTSRPEDLAEYPSMTQLVGEIMSAEHGGEKGGRRMMEEEGEGGEGGKLAKDEGHQQRKGIYQQHPHLRELPPRLAKFQSPRHNLHHASPPPVAIVIPSQPSIFATSSSPLPPDDPECRRLPLATRPNWRLALSSLPQSIYELCCLAYIWMASSLAFFLDRLF